MAHKWTYSNSVAQANDAFKQNWSNMNTMQFH